VERAALYIALLGMFVLFCFMFLLEPAKISGKTNISIMLENAPVHFEGRVIAVGMSGSDYKVSLDNGLSFFSDYPVKPNESLTVKGITELYYETMRIRALSIIK